MGTLASCLQVGAGDPQISFSLLLTQAAGWQMEALPLKESPALGSGSEQGCSLARHLLTMASTKQFAQHPLAQPHMVYAQARGQHVRLLHKVAASLHRIYLLRQVLSNTADQHSTHLPGKL